MPDAPDPVPAASPTSGAPSSRRHRPKARLRPEALARARGGAREGLDWLGRRPEAKASLLYRLFRLVVRFVLFGLCRFRIETSGQEHLPRGGYLLIAGAHRGWMDPFVAMHAVPAEPRCWFLGSGPSTFTARWREVLIHRLGGLLPVWRGGLGVEGHVRSARAVVDAGAVFVQMPEGTVNGPPGRLGPFRPGAALIALRTGATIVPLAMAGTEELYLGRRMASRVLPPTSVRDLLAGTWDGVAPAPDSREELELAKRASEALAARIGPVVEELHPGTVDPPGHPKRLRRRLTWLLLGPGPLDREGAAT
jgi:1-acyl-sn-glycerol-3-phosphate acyltransferase